MAQMRYRILRNMFLAIFITTGLVACSEQGSSGQAEWYSRNPLYTYSSDQGNFWNTMRPNLHMAAYTYTPQVRDQIKWFEHHQAYLNHVLIESAPYIYYIYQQTQAHHLPAELALIPVIESEYNPYAKSHVGAMGLWQMMPTTARGFGLKRDWWYDGRKDVIASTNAALDYFKYLHEFFNDNWLLAIAAYDCGEGTVMQCVHYNQYHGSSTTFWNLPLPNETRDYVPRLLAVAAIIKDPSRYHIELAPIDNSPYVEPVNVGKPIALSNAAKLADVPLSTMRVLNPGIQHNSTDPKGPFSLLVPEDKAETFKMRLAGLSEHERIAWQQHIVKSRETLQKIAAEFGTTVAELRKINGLTSDKLHANQTILIPPLAQPDVANNSSAPTTLAFNKPITNFDAIKSDSNQDIIQDALSQSQTNSQVAPATNPITNNASDTANANTDQPLAVNYQVKSGDDLRKIAKRFHTTTTKLSKANHLTNHTLKIGQTLVIPSDNVSIASNDTNDTAASKTNAVSKNSSSSHSASHSKKHHHIIYTVREGDYVEKIAKRFNVSTQEVKKWNEISENTILRPGQKIVIFEKA